MFGAKKFKLYCKEQMKIKKYYRGSNRDNSKG